MKFKITLKVWWSIVWRYLIVMFVVGYIWGLCGGNYGDAEIIGNIIAAPLSFIAVHYALKIHFGDKDKEKDETK